MPKAKSKKIIPAEILHRYGVKNKQQFKTLKRTQAREAKEALESLLEGSEYFPSKDRLVNAAIKAVDKIRADLAIKKFGR